MLRAPGLGPTGSLKWPGEFCVSQRKVTAVTCHFHPNHQVEIPSPWLVTDSLALCHLAEVAFLRTCHCKLTVVPITLYPLEKSQHTQTARQEWTAVHGRWGVCIKYLGLFCIGDFSPLPPATYLFEYLFISIQICDIYFILGNNPIWWVINQHYNLLLKLFQLWPLGTISVGFCVPLTYPCHCGCLFVCF